MFGLVAGSAVQLDQELACTEGLIFADKNPYAGDSRESAMTGWGVDTGFVELPFSCTEQ